MAEKQLPHYQRFLGERTVTARFAYQKASNGQLWCFFFVSPNMLLNKQWSCRWFETPRCSCDATAMSGTSVVPVKMCESKQFTKKHMHGWPSTQPGTCTQPCPIVHTAVPRENNEHGCVYLRCRAVCKLPGCVEGHPWYVIKTSSDVIPTRLISGTLSACPIDPRKFSIQTFDKMLANETSCHNYT